MAWMVSETCMAMEEETPLLGLNVTKAVAEACMSRHRTRVSERSGGVERVPLGLFFLLFFLFLLSPYQVRLLAEAMIAVRATEGWLARHGADGGVTDARPGKEGWMD